MNQNNNIFENFSQLFSDTRIYLVNLLDFRKDADQISTIEEIKANIQFKGATAWILICSILVASIGLNTNSIPVVIGAMLISPLMGPILGVGLSIAINDIDTLKTSLISLGTMIILSILTSFIYFWIFDINADTPIPVGGRPHPMQSLIERIRSVFLEMGFSEIEGDYVQSAGWNMDALFIPQSHPARTMQDTFYLEQPEKIDIPDEMLDLWASVHENGHDTGSLGWGSKFDKEESKKGLLRTHTTVNTVKYIAENPDNPSRVFGIGRVFRQETIDRTHLPEFHQIEGIIHEPNASLPMLISTLKTFYSKMGYPDVRVRPAYFPYTEPSVEVEVYWRGKWLELGGAGIFRPEVTEPLGSEWPVCAWGMGLERLAMLVLELDDIRELYQPDLERLSRMPIL